MIKALIFDLDDTLIDRDETTRNFLYGQYDRMQSLLRIVPREDYVNIIIKLQDHGYGDKLNAYREICGRFEIKDISPEALLDDFDKHYGDKAVILDHVYETLELLHAKYPLAIITNSRTHWQNTKIDSVNLRHYFREIIISEAAGMEKPDKRIFEHCANLLKVTTGECVYIGDHPVNDISGALNSGMKAVWVTNPHYPPPEKAHGIVEIFSDLPELVKKISHSSSC